MSPPNVCRSGSKGVLSRVRNDLFPVCASGLSETTRPFSTISLPLIRFAAVGGRSTAASPQAAAHSPSRSSGEPRPKCQFVHLADLALILGSRSGQLLAEGRAAFAAMGGLESCGCCGDLVPTWLWPAEAALPPHMSHVVLQRSRDKAAAADIAITCCAGSTATPRSFPPFVHIMVVLAAAACATVVGDGASTVATATATAFSSVAIAAAVVAQREL
eukprot:CAMPEP_0172720862 /NCGR_PEP_ID=MMETSP1074-20121228/77838_1 /TAXON_ID=2916 /ORGANISM="Ceratium fusus, Strain PA161109" /LENGTH=216 /DNA_ID=CAMNT_0013546469 /DNA_START=438 /DNA_END=1090 /DNA_ORIENTATION=+